MPFQNVASKLVLIIAVVLVHHALVARSAPPGLVPVAEVPTNLASATSGVGNTSAEMPLLDATKLPFLAGCNADKISEKLCEQYRTLVATVLTHRTVEDVQKAAQEKMDSESFCDNLVPVVKNRKAKHPEDVDNPLEKHNFCTLWCVKMMDDLTTLGVNPICKVLLWGFRQEVLSEQETVPEDLGEKVAGAVVPPLLAQNVKLPEVVKNEESPVETKPEEPVATQPNITDPKKIIQEPTVPKSISAAADTKESASDTAAAKAPLVPAVAEKPYPTTAKGATTVASKVQQKPTPGAADEATVDEDNQQLDDTDAQNEDNIIANNNDGNAGLNGGENTDEMYDDDELPQQPAVPKESQVKEERDPIDEEQRDTDFSVEQPAAAAAVQIERVDPFFDQDDSNFFSYFMFMMFACIACYVAYHNKSKLMALLVEGRRSNSGRGGFSKGRKHTAAYRKLDSNLEEAITSNASASSRSTSQIIY